MKKRKHKLLLGYAIIFMFIIVGFSGSILAYVSRTHLEKVDTDLMLLKTSIQKASGRVLEIDTPFNPKMLVVLRDGNGNLDDRMPVPDWYLQNVLHLTPESKDSLETVSAGNFMYRTIKFDAIYRGQMYSVQILYNIDSDIDAMYNLRRILVNGSVVILFFSLFISNFLADIAVKPLEEALERQREFLENASHELRTPISIIQSRLEGLLRDPEKKIIDKYEYIEPAIRETRRMGKMVSNLMVLTRADAGEALGEVERFNLTVLGEEISEIYREFASIQEKPFRYVSGGDVFITANREKLHQLLIILLDNALKYTGTGEALELVIESQKDKAIIKVADEGIGIKEENLENVFLRFFREDKARARTTGGTGLGLSIARWITECHGGTIKAYRNKTKGTVIEVVLPRENHQRPKKEIARV